MSFTDIIQIISENLLLFLDSLLETMIGKDHKLKAGFGKASKILKRTHEGFCLDGKRSISIQQSCSNVLTVAPSGKGKTQVSVFPFMLRQKGKYSIICNDPSGEISAVIPYLESVGIQTAILDFGKKTGVYFNPLDGCKENITQMRKVAKALMNSNTKENDFFTVSAEDVLVLFIQYLMESESRVYQNITNVYRLILEYQGSPEVVEKLLATKASEGVWKKFKSLAATSDNTRKSILASCLSAISFIGDNPTLCDITSISTMNFKDFRETPHALFIHVPVGDVQFYAPILNLFFQEFYRFAFAELPKKDDLEIFMILDEFDTLGAIQDYSTIISNSRKAKIPQQIILQSESQLSKYGKKAQNILNNCNIKCYYGGLGQETFELEKTLGKYEYEDKKTKQIRQRSLMTASEIRELKEEILIIPSGEKPLKVKVTPAYLQSQLMERLHLEIPEVEEGVEIPPMLEYTAQYLDLEIYREIITNKKQQDEDSSTTLM